jgi:hypothetical protein
LVVLGELSGQLSWATAVLLAIALPAAAVLTLRLGPRARAVAVAAAVAALLAAPATWAAETLGHATNGTFPTGGAASALLAGGPGGPGGAGFARGGRLPMGAAGGPGGRAGGGFAGSLGGLAAGPPAGGMFAGPPPGGAGTTGGAGGPGGFGSDGASLQAAVRYAAAHGGGTIGVASQSSAAAAIISTGANVAGLGGFSGRESSVSVGWLASAVRSGRLRWVIADQSGGAPGDTRAGSSSAFAAVARACRADTVSTGTGGTSAGASGASTGTSTIYDCAGRAARLLAAARA